jgi:hypothetical protein
MHRMAPLITTSLREYAMDQVRRAERNYFATNVDNREEWLGLQDWTESPDTLQSFHDAEDRLGEAMGIIDKYIDQHDIPEDHPLWQVGMLIDAALSDLDDARAVITNICRKDMRA